LRYGHLSYRWLLRAYDSYKHLGVNQTLEGLGEDVNNYSVETDAAPCCHVMILRHAGSVTLTAHSVLLKYLVDLLVF